MPRLFILAVSLLHICIYICTILVETCLVSGSNCWLLCCHLLLDKGMAPLPSSPPCVVVCRLYLTHRNSSALINSVSNSHFSLELCPPDHGMLSEQVAPLCALAQSHTAPSTPRDWCALGRAAQDPLPRKE